MTQVYIRTKLSLLIDHVCGRWSITNKHFLPSFLYLQQEHKLQQAKDAAIGEGVQSKALRDKLVELEREIERFRKENSQLEKLRKERDEVCMACASSTHGNISSFVLPIRNEGKAIYTELSIKGILCDCKSWYYRVNRKINIFIEEFRGFWNSLRGIFCSFWSDQSIMHSTLCKIAIIITKFYICYVYTLYILCVSDVHLYLFGQYI